MRTSVSTNQLPKKESVSQDPKHLHVTNYFLQAIGSGKIKKGEVLPSINKLSSEMGIHRNIVERSYKHLKEQGILGSVHGKGYFVKETDTSKPVKIFLLFNKLSDYKKNLYDSLIASLGSCVTVDFHIYNNDYSRFRSLLMRHTGEYDFYVVIPPPTQEPEIADLLNSVPEGKLILMDRLVEGITSSHAAVYENFENDIYTALEKAFLYLAKYHTIKIILPEYDCVAIEILRGFKRFCDKYDFNGFVVQAISEEPLGKGEVFISLTEDDLVTLIERLTASNLKVGKDVGLISYNESPLKNIILNGITTISTDFQMMGRKVAQLIKEHSFEHFEVPFSLTLRGSL